MTHVSHVHVGKVRNSVSLKNGTRVIHTTDRISAFDSILPFSIPGKGEILQAISTWFFTNTRHIIDNHLIGSLDKNHILVKEARVLPLEIVVRGYLSGSLWRLYQTQGQAGVFAKYGVTLDKGIAENEKLPSPIVTPTTKAKVGHDEAIDEKGILETLDTFLKENSDQRGSYSSAADLWRDAKTAALKLFDFGSQTAEKKDLVLVDTKYEMALHNGKLILVDEIHTPDSSRYWPKPGGKSKRAHLSKEYLRQKILENKHESEDVRNEVFAIYKELYDTLIPESLDEIFRKTKTEWTADKEFLSALERDVTMPRRVLIVGNGAREHALFKLIQTHAEVDTIYCSPGQRHWGTKYADCDATAPEQILTFVKDNGIGLVIVGPELPLAQGLTDLCRKAGVPVLGPSKYCAQLETSKTFCKDVAVAAGVKTPAASKVTWQELKGSAATAQNFPFVLKYDGLAAGKGVFIIQNEKDFEDALERIHDEIPQWHELSCRLSGSTTPADGALFLKEAMVSGHELSAIALCNGTQHRLLPIARDYKRRNDGQVGPNTGGMGAVSPVPVSKNVLSQINDAFERILKEMAERGHPYSGFLYCGFMKSADESLWLLECNCRLGDPEAQVLLPGTRADFVVELMRTARGEAFLFDKDAGDFFWHDGKNRVFVVGASPEYPEKSAPRREVVGVGSLDSEDCFYSYAVDQRNTSAGGRVLGVISAKSDLQSARAEAYERLEKLSLKEGDKAVPLHFRSDVGLDVLEEMKRT